MNPLKSIIGSHRFQVWMRKRSTFMPITRFFARYSLRPYFSTDLRLFRLLYCAQLTRHLRQPIAEVGVGSGYGMTYMLTMLRDTGDAREYHGFDTFEGFPYVHNEDLVGLPEHRKSKTKVGHYAEFGIEHQQRLIDVCGMHERATLHKGRFEESLPALRPDMQFSFVFLDCDLYQSYITSLTYLYDRVVEGGIILFDEYETTEEWPGARKAIDKFFSDKPERPQSLPFGTSWFVIKGNKR